MFELFRAGGPLMWIILACSVIALTIVFERLFSLRRNKVAPSRLLEQVLEMLEKGSLTPQKAELVAQHSPLGSVLSAGLANLHLGRDSMREAIEERGKQVVHRMGHYLNALGTIASITPLIGLLGTVIGMIKVFTAITVSGVGDPTILSGGISEALITTAAGLSVGIPCLMFYRYFRNKISELSVIMEDDALALLDSQR